MKKRVKDNNPKQLEKDGIRTGDSRSVLSDTHEHRKEENPVVTPEMLNRLAAIVRVIIKRIRSPTKSSD